MEKWVKSVRTMVQCLIALIPAAPFLVPALGLSATAGVGASIVALAGALARVMAIPAVETFLATLGIQSRHPSE